MASLMKPVEYFQPSGARSTVYHTFRGRVVGVKGRARVRARPRVREG